MSGNLARRRQTKFMPADFKLIEARQPPLKDQYDEWLARIICYAFSVPVSPFVSQVNRATGETMRQQATQEGLVPLKAWVKNALDHVIQECMAERGSSSFGSATTPSIRCSRRRRCKSWSAPASRRPRRRGRIWGSRLQGAATRAPQTPLRLPMRHLVRAQTALFPGH